MDRRTILRAGLAIPLIRPEAPLPAATQLSRPPAGLTCSLGYRGVSPTPASIVPPPFTVPLPIPDELDGADISLNVGVAQVELLPGFSTRMLTYEKSFPGPTIIAGPDHDTAVRVANAYDEDVVVHLHGGHTAAAFDGHPLTWWRRGRSSPTAIPTGSAQRPCGITTTR